MHSDRKVVSTGMYSEWKLVIGMTQTEEKNILQNREYLLKIANARMPFGKYKGRLLIDLPEPYVVWFAQKGFPKGELGRMLQLMYEIKVNGLEYLFDPLRPTAR